LQDEVLVLVSGLGAPLDGCRFFTVGHLALVVGFSIPKIFGREELFLGLSRFSPWSSPEGKLGLHDLVDC
jgi:hypothetical protein